MKHKSRYIGILVVALFACSSLASPDLFVLCRGEGDAARIEPFHIANSACRAGPVHRCAHPGGLPAEIHHRHVRCTDVGLSGHLGLVKEPERLPEVACFWTWTLPARAGLLGSAAGTAALAGSVPAANLVNHPPGIDLQSVVLLI